MRKPRPLPPLELIEDIFSYDPVEGIVYKYDKPCGTHNRNGWVRVCFKGNEWPAHRIAWLLYYRKDPGDAHVRHINGCYYDNRIDNLRLTRRRIRRSGSGRPNIGEN